MTSRIYLTLGLTIAAVAFGGWRMLLPGTGSGTSDVTDGVSSLVSATLQASFTAGQASLDAQMTATGSYAGAVVRAPLTLVRADAASYCLQLEQGPVLQHLDGPGGTAQPGAC
jgi:hypothetical protein